MARKSYLDLINDVLVRLREPMVSSPTSNAYAALVGKFVNDAKREVEDAWRWNDLRNVFTVQTVSGVKLYSLTGFGDRFRLEEIWNDDRNLRVKPAADWFIERKLNLETDPGGTPEWWRLFGRDAAGDARIEFYPTPNGIEAINVYAIVGQADLTDGMTEISVPHRPVVLRAYSLAVSERGEHGGTLFDETTRAYDMALSEAIAQDNSNVARGLTSDWRIE